MATDHNFVTLNPVDLPNENHVSEQIKKILDQLDEIVRTKTHSALLQLQKELDASINQTAETLKSEIIRREEKKK